MKPLLCFSYLTILPLIYINSENGGLEIIAFPCNSFGAQEPKENSEILEFARSKGAQFPVMGKIPCENGSDTHPLYTFLRSATPDKVLEPSLKWNFAKFLCNADGVPVKGYLPKKNPLSFESDIVALL